MKMLSDGGSTPPASTKQPKSEPKGFGFCAFFFTEQHRIFEGQSALIFHIKVLCFYKTFIISRFLHVISAINLLFILCNMRIEFCRFLIYSVFITQKKEGPIHVHYEPARVCLHLH